MGNPGPVPAPGSIQRVVNSPVEINNKKTKQEENYHDCYKD
jgi:hypothetical protein